MKRFYNQSNEQKQRKTHYDHRFWELPVEHAVINRLAEHRGLWHEAESEQESRNRRAERAALLMHECEKLLTLLTKRQQQVLDLYFFQGMTVYEIGDRLNIDASSVSQHLFGKKRSGKTVGGAITKLRKEAKRLNLDW